MKNKINTTVIDILNENEEKSLSKNKKEREHVNFFKHFLLPRVYITLNNFYYQEFILLL